MKTKACKNWFYNMRKRHVDDVQYFNRVFICYYMHLEGGTLCCIPTYQHVPVLEIKTVRELCGKREMLVFIFIAFSDCFSKKQLSRVYDWRFSSFNSYVAASSAVMQAIKLELAAKLKERSTPRNTLLLTFLIHGK